MKGDVGRDSCLYVHVTLVPYVGAAKELKTKPTQHSVKSCAPSESSPTSSSVARSDPLSEEIKRKIALFCDIDPEAVIPNATRRQSTKCLSSLRRKGWTRSSSAGWG